MLNPNYNYVSFDLETTGLNKQEDEIIQIAIVKFNAEGTIIKSFKSLVQPRQHTVAQFISFLTGISNNDIQKSPHIEELKKEILSFFDEKSVIVGHNIQFDIDFLTRHFPELTFKDQIDTYQLSKHFVHFPPSYALEVLVEFLEEKDENFGPLRDRITGDRDTDSHHNAMSDTLNSFCLFLYCIERIQLIEKKYPVIINILNYFEGIWSEILTLSHDWRGNIIGSITLPSLSYSITPERKIVIENQLNLSDLTPGSSFYVGETPLKTILEKIIGQDKLILCFDTVSKLTIAKKILSGMGIEHTHNLYDPQTIDQKKFTNFLNKGTFSNEEIFFILKYLSTKMKGYSIIQMHSPIDYHIMSYIKKPSPLEKKGLLLATHNAFFANRKDPKLQGYQVVFFDSDFWYKNYNQWNSRPIDGYNILYNLEALLYCYRIKKNTQIIHELELLYDKVLFFIGCLSLEISNFLKVNKSDKLGVNPLLQNKFFPKTTQLWQEIIKMQDVILAELTEEEIHSLGGSIEEMDHILNSIVTINERIHYGSGETYFVLSEHGSFTEWSEFLEIFNQNPTIFLSTSNKSFPKLFEIDKETYNNTGYITKESSIEKITTTIKDKKNIGDDKCCFFILSTKKFESENIFNILIQDEFFQSYTILGENITGGNGKNVFKAKKSGKTILVGGYNFLLALYAAEIFPHHIFIHNMFGNMQKTLLHDILRYGNSFSSPVGIH